MVMPVEAREAKRKRKVVSYKDVQIAYLLGGIARVQPWADDGQATGPVLKRALKELRAQGHNVTDLAEFVAARFGNSGRGRSVPQPGEERRYKAQQVKGGAPFLRLPLSTLATPKGGEVRVRFEDDKIVVAPA